MKTFGLLVPKGRGGMFGDHVRSLLETNTALAQIILPMLDACKACAPGLPG